MSQPASPDAAFQDAMPGNHCWGCGSLNPQGLRIRSRWRGDEAVCLFQPAPQFTGGSLEMVYGGLLSAALGCHAVGTATADAFRREGRAMTSAPPITYVNASLKLDFLKPAPMGAALELRARVAERHERKSVVQVSAWAGETECARGEIVTVRLKVPRVG